MSSFGSYQLVLIETMPLSGAGDEGVGTTLGQEAGASSKCPSSDTGLASLTYHSGRREKGDTLLLEDASAHPCSLMITRGL